MNLEDTIKDSEYFLTGVTGFVGHYLLYKLLHIQQKHGINDKKIYVLVRPNKQYSNIQHRLENGVLKNKLFDEIDETFKQNVIAIKGELCVKNEDNTNYLNISNQDLNILNAANIQTFVHIAASISFTDEFNTAINMNVNGTFQCLELVKQLNIPNFIYVSTAVANARKDTGFRVIQEKLYKYDEIGDGYQLFTKWNNNENKCFSKKKCNKIMNHWNNTYQVSKHITEWVVDKFCKDNNIKFAIIRCGTIGPSSMNGWYLRLRSCPSTWVWVNAIDDGFYFKPGGTGSFDNVPVDICINDILLVNGGLISDDLNMNIIGTIYHCTSMKGMENIISIKNGSMKISEIMQNDPRFNELTQFQKQNCIKLSNEKKWREISDFKFGLNLLKKILTRKRNVRSIISIKKSIGVRKLYCFFSEKNKSLYQEKNSNILLSHFDENTQDTHSTKDFSLQKYTANTLLNILINRNQSNYLRNQSSFAMKI